MKFVYFSLHSVIKNTLQKEFRVCVRVKLLIA